MKIALTALALTEPAGVLQGSNSRGSPGYYGPTGKMLDVLPGASRDDVLKAAAGHVLARGGLVGTFGQTDPPLK